MMRQDLADTAHGLMADGRGLLAMDESNGTCDARFAAAGIPQTEAARRSYREMLATTPRLSECISGAILFDETIRQRTRSGMPFARLLAEAGIVPGIKVDMGAKPLAGFHGERVTEGLDGLRERLSEYHAMGARFAKWRAVLAIGGALPSAECIDANAHALARYAALCQEAGMVPVIEPEVLMEGTHSLAHAASVAERVLRAVFAALAAHRVLLEGMILKPAMVLAGDENPEPPTANEVADATLRCLRRTVPSAVAGIAFLSGGQSGALASERLNAMNVRGAGGPWPLAFSFARAIQHPALEIWQGHDANVPAAQRALLHRAECNRAARQGAYGAAVEAG